MTDAKILVVEDEPVIALDIQRRLLHLGYTVAAIADSAENAIEGVASFQPDLVLMDIRIRGERDGIATAMQLRQQFDVPIVFLTAHADAATVAQVKAVQPFGYIIKPFETHDLITAIEVALSRHQAESAIQSALKKERELNELKSHFVSVVSHEFRNPLSSILFSIDLLERHDLRLPFSKKQVYFQRARASVDRMKQLLDDVLIIGEAEAGKLRYEPEPLNVFAFCSEIVADFQATEATGTMAAHTITLTETGAVPPRGTQHLLDAKLLRHILTNLLSNAIKYSPSGEMILLELTYQPTKLLFRIQDSGIGIPTTDLERLFDRFHRASNARMIPGTGLGLSIVKQCVETHGGMITVKSTLGEGTTFIVTLPTTIAAIDSTTSTESTPHS